MALIPRCLGSASRTFTTATTTGFRLVSPEDHREGSPETTTTLTSYGLTGFSKLNLSTLWLRTLTIHGTAMENTNTTELSYA